MIRLSGKILAGYRLALNLYPAEFREHNRSEMLNCASDIIAQSACLGKTTWILTYDLVRSLLLEYFAMSIARIRNGFVVAGRNMREVENREATVFKLAAVGWLVANAVLLFLWFATPLFENKNQHSLQAV